jgi:hypothetical protein
LRRHYDEIVCAVSPNARLRAAPIDLPPVARLPAELREPAERIRAEAEEVVAGRVDVLGSGLVKIGPEIDWHLDFKSGYRWSPTTFYQDLEVTRLTDASDAKVPWELSRGHQLLTLARAARLFEDERFARTLERQLASWIDANRPGYGINWSNPMEIALRAVNWIWAIRTLEAWRTLDARLRKLVTAALQSHARHVQWNLEGSPLLRSNHYLSDILGLLVLGAALEGDPAAGGWIRFASAEFERQLLEQVHEDGVGFEASTAYHGLALEIFLLARVVAHEQGRAFSGSYDERLGRMLDVSQAIRHPTGRIPLFGDGDSGRVLPAGFSRPATHDPLLWLGAVLLGRPRPIDGPASAEVAWTLGVRGWRNASELSRRGEVPSAFPDGGLYVLRGGGAHAVVRCGDVGQNGGGGHAHNDVLSYELSYGVPVVVDSGTYAYTADPAARNSFRSTAAHNALSVDGVEINPLRHDDLFHLTQLACARVEEWRAEGEVARLVVSHDGYRGLEGGVIHRRTFELDRKSGSLSIVDDLLGAGIHHAESFVHLAPGTSVVLKEPRWYELVCDDVCVSLVFWGASREVELTEGWISSEFGRRERALLLVARHHGSLPARFGYTFASAQRPTKLDRAAESMAAS